MDDFAEVEVDEVNLVRTPRDAVLWLVDVVGCTEEEAIHALSQSAGDISEALDILPSIQNSSIKGAEATDQEIRRLIDSADNKMSCLSQAPDVIDIPEEKMSSFSQAPDVIEIPEDDAVEMCEESSFRVKRVQESTHVAVSTTARQHIEATNGTPKFESGTKCDGVHGDGVHGDDVGRIASKTGVSRDRAKAALRMAGGKEDDATQLIQVSLSRDRKRIISTEPAECAAPTECTAPIIELPSQPITAKDVLVLSWNVDGLCERGVSERFSAVISQIKTSQPNLVLLQEIVDEHVARIQSSLGVSYDVTFGNRSSAYFNAILVSKKAGGVKIIDKCVRKFPKSIMDRHYVQVTCELYGQKITIFTSHLESMKDHSVERISQVNQIMQEMKAIDSENFVIFGGDTNLRDAEMVRVARLDGIYDVWERLGRSNNTRYTWDTSVNKNTQAPYKCKLRFDRIFVRSSETFVPKSLDLIGTTLLRSCDMFPSDHWGLMAKFSILPAK